MEAARWSLALASGGGGRAWPFKRALPGAAGLSAPPAARGKGPGVDSFQPFCHVGKSRPELAQQERWGRVWSSFPEHAGNQVVAWARRKRNPEKPICLQEHIAGARARRVVKNGLESHGAMTESCCSASVLCPPQAPGGSREGPEGLSGLWGKTSQGSSFVLPSGFLLRGSPPEPSTIPSHRA